MFPPHWLYKLAENRVYPEWRQIFRLIKQARARNKAEALKFKEAFTRIKESQRAIEIRQEEIRREFDRISRDFRR